MDKSPTSELSNRPCEPSVLLGMLQGTVLYQKSLWAAIVRGGYIPYAGVLKQFWE